MEQNETLIENEEMAAQTTSHSGLASFVEEKYSEASTGRQAQERIWMTCYRNYRGIYDPDMEFRKNERSKVFVKVTKTKVLAAFSQICDVLFGGNKFPITIEPTSVPEGIEEAVHLEVNPDTEKATQELLPGETMAGFKARTADLKPVEQSLRPGVAPTPSAVSFFPADKAAKKMEKKIHDQLEESSAKSHLRSSVFELTLFGTGVLKGPYLETKEYPDWEIKETEEGVESIYSPVFKDVPKLSHTSIWDFYPDPNATCARDMQYAIETHRLSRSEMRKLKSRPFFIEEDLEKAIHDGPDWNDEYWEHVMDNDATQVQNDRYKVIEYWGYVDKEVLETEDAAKEVLKGLKDSQEVALNVWVCNGRVIRCVVNPYQPMRIPYYTVPYEINPYSVWGVGLAENMEDSQMLMNGFARLAVDNSALSGNILLEVDRNFLAEETDLSDIYPGKVFEREGGAPGHAVHGITIPNIAPQNLQMYETFRRQADESTGFPSFAHGQTGVQGIGRTASGISMLMSAANHTIKTVVKNVDDYLLKPVGQSFFAFNMQYDPDPEIRGDLAVKAGATDSLMANEVRSQRIMQFLSIVQAQPLMPFANFDYLIQEVAKTLDLDPERVANSMAQAALQAKLVREYQEAMGGGVEPQAPEGNLAEDPTGTGGGTIGTGQAPAPGEEGFSGNPPEEVPV